MTTKDKKLFSEWVIDQIKETKENYCGKQFINKFIYIELGRQQPMYYTGVKRMQITIRDIKLNKKYQKQGILTGLVQYILETVGCVQLESITNTELLKKISGSVLWKSVYDSNKNEIGSSYYRVQEKTDKSVNPFKLY